jgi:hypothetical protein
MAAEPSDNTLTLILVGVGGAIATAAGVGWKALEKRHAALTEALETRIEALEAAVKAMQTTLENERAENEKKLALYRHERTNILTSLAVAEAKVDAIIRHAELRPLGPADIMAIVGDPEDEHMSKAVLARYASVHSRSAQSDANMKAGH